MNISVLSFSNPVTISQKIFHGVFLLVCFLLFLPDNLIAYPAIGLDPSWAISLTEAFLNNAEFGNTYVFTYGPLGFLSTKTILSVSKWYVVIFDLYVALNFLYLVHLFLKKQNHPVSYLLVLLTFIIANNLAFETHLIIFLIIYISMLTDEWDISIGCNSLFISILLFFIKLNYGLIGITLFLMLSMYAIFTKKIKVIHGIALIGCAIGSVFILSALLNVALKNYIINSLYIISGYNNTMNVLTWPSIRSLIYSLPIIAFLGIYTIIQIWKNYKNVSLYIKAALLFMLIFIFFKYAYLRADGHSLTFFRVVPFFMFIVWYFFEGNTRFFFFSTIVVFVLTVVGQIVIVYNEIAFYEMAIKPKIYYNPLGYNYLRETFEYRDATAVAPELAEERILPQDVLIRLKGKSVDVMPWETSFTYINKLNHHPRPIPQSYSAYNYHLDRLDSAFFAGNTSPDFLMLTTLYIDERHPFWEESATKRILLKNYSFVQKIDLKNKDSIDYILLEKNNSSSAFQLIRTSETKTGFNKVINVPSSENFIFLKTKFKFPLIEKGKKFIFQSSIFWIKMNLSDGRTLKYRVLPDIMESGVLINIACADLNELTNLFSNHPEKNARVTSFKFETEDKTAKNTEIEITFMEMK